MKIRKGDKVKVITGKDKGKEGTILKVFTSDNKVLVEGVNIVKKHVKPGAVDKEGGIISMEKPVNASNVMVVNPKTKTPEKIGYKIEEGKKTRYFKKTGNVIK
ncbi:50S ribosomal protein L24 [candidate division WWE3 bacterium]|jgi:large subunit ribosomal protein L24|nr:50S ribosomal protein L24 [candidate division WWE3 bacterium]MBT7349532.1 50S ribosomal protein L24 [candidate division WWE3 bacterium]